ncbi:MAG TPA: hypothetical protein VGQ36_09420 [Thermoanaerobaculia bacterium]|jgi:hypothetical protein|nr:hypothetical protein [Thermoanaerobaculia bacterium]
MSNGELVPPTVTRYQLLAEEIARDLEAVAAKMPKLEAAHRRDDDFIRAHVNVPVRFMATTISAVEQTPELERVKRLDTIEGHDTLQFLGAFKAVHDQLTHLADSLKFTMKSRKARLAWQSLQIYAIARGLARDGSHPSIAAYVDILRRDLGPRGRPRKKKTEAG